MIKYYLLILFFKLSLNKTWYEDSKVLDINIDNIDEIIGQDKHVFVKFFTPWCFYCKQMKYEYEELFRKITQEQRINNLIIARINCEFEDDTCNYFNIHSYPTLALYFAGSFEPQIYPHEMGPSSENMIIFINQMIVIDHNNKVYEQQGKKVKLDNQKNEDKKNDDKFQELNQIYEQAIQYSEFINLQQSQKNKQQKNNLLVTKIDLIARDYNLQTQKQLEQVKQLQDQNINQYIFIYIFFGIYLGNIISQLFFKIF